MQSSLILFVILSTPVMIVMGLITVFLFICLNLIFGNTKYNSTFINIMRIIWGIPFIIGFFWYYILRKILISTQKGILIEYPFKKTKLITWNNISSIEFLHYGMGCWVVNVKNKDIIGINLDFLDSIIHAAKYNGVKVIE